MPFTQSTLSKSSTGYAHVISGQEWIYSSVTDDLDTIKSDGYFDQAAALFAVGELFNVRDNTFEADLIEIFEINPAPPRIKTRPFVSAGSIADGSVTTPKIAALAVTTPKIGELAVTTAKIADLGVTKTKLSTNVQMFAKVINIVSQDLTNKVQTVVVPGAQLNDFPVTTLTTMNSNTVFLSVSRIVFAGQVEVVLSAAPPAEATAQVMVLRLVV